MKIEYDSEKSETILHLDANRMGKILFALDLVTTEASNPRMRTEAHVLRDEIRKGMETAKVI